MLNRALSSFDSLRERPFRLLWMGRTLSGVGDALVPVATTFAVLDLGDASDLGLVLGAYMTSRMLFVVVGGVWADRLPRQLVMVAADVVRAVVQAVIALAFFTDMIAVWQLALSSALFGIASAFFGPASTGLVPQLVSAGRLQEAHALLGLSRNAIEIFGPAISGILVATVGYGIVFAIDSASFVASFACLVGIRLPARIQQPERKGFLTEARDGLREVLARRWLVVTLCCDAVTNLTLAVYFVLGPLVVAEHFGGATDWGLMMTAGAVGGLAGGALVLHFKPARPLFAAYVILIACPLQLAALAVPAVLPVLMVGAGLLVLSIVAGNTFWETMEQQYIPNESLSRVDSISWMVSLIAMPLGYAVAGPISDAVGVTTTLLAAAALSAVALATALAMPSVRELRRLDLPGPTAAAPVGATSHE